MAYQPPFQLTNRMTILVANIAELVGSAVGWGERANPNGIAEMRIGFQSVGFLCFD
jgi:hypothetical protein